MTRSPRTASTLVLFTLFVAAATMILSPAPCPGQDAPAASVDPELRAAADSFWHYAKIARYDLATTELQKVLAQKGRPAEVLQTLEAVAAERNDNLDEWLLRWSRIDAMKDPTVQLISILEQGRRTRVSDPAWIQSQIKRLGVNSRAFALAMQNLRYSGELAVPQMIDVLRDPNQRELQGAVRNALRELGRLALNPLVAATVMKDHDTLIDVSLILGDIGYDAAVPYLARLANSSDAPASVKSAATRALRQMGAGDPSGLNAANLFYELGEKFYYDHAAIKADPRSPTANIWLWQEDKGLTRTQVPPEIFNEIMAMRSCEYALKLNLDKPEAVSLWLASDYKREAELPEGANDPLKPIGTPSAHFYAVSSGVPYLNGVITRAIRDRSSPVALRATKSMQEIIGRSAITDQSGTNPVVDALRFPDRLVRFEAAFALAAALPQQEFAGKERVVPILAEAVAQTGRTSALVIYPTDAVAGIIEALRGPQMLVAGADTAEAAIAEALALPSVDVVVINADGFKGDEVERMLGLIAANPRLEGAVRLIVSQDAMWQARTANNSLMAVTKVKEGAALAPVIEEARKKTGSIPMDEALATQYALRASDYLLNLEINNNPVLDVSMAEPTLLAVLSNDIRPENVKAAGKVVARLPSKPAQQALLAKAGDEKTPEDARISLYKSVATSAKLHGNQLDAEQVQALQKAIQGGLSVELRSAAAEAHGALSLPADEAKRLIVDQSKILGGPKPAAAASAQ